VLRQDLRNGATVRVDGGLSDDWHGLIVNQLVADGLGGYGILGVCFPCPCGILASVTSLCAPYTVSKFAIVKVLYALDNL
jgi:hypothetical protein